MAKNRSDENEESEIVKAEKKVKGTVTSLVTSPEAKITAGVVAAGTGGIIAAGLIGVGPLAIAGAAGYLAYRGLTGQRI